MTYLRSNTWLVYTILVVLSIAGLWLILLVGESITLHGGSVVQAPTSGNATAGAASLGGFTAALSTALHHPLALLLAQVIVIVLCAQGCGYALQKLGQPRVIGEILAGIMLGPSLIGAIWPEFSGWIFPQDSLPKLHLMSQIGLVLFMFVVGMEINLGSLRAHAREALLISHMSVVFPFLLGATLAIWLFEGYAASHVSYTIFALFMGIAMSITAFPVLARILMDRGMIKSPLGMMALTCAAVDDVTAWCLLAIIVALAQAGSVGGASYILLFTLIYIAAMLWLVRPWIDRLIGSAELDRRVMVSVLLLLLISALTTELIGLHALFGAFLAGVIMPSREHLRRAIAARIEDVSTLILLPLFFAFTGLRTEIALIDDLQSWLICGLIILVAILGKLGGSALTARWSGMPWADSLVLGALMNTRGLMELVVLNIGYDLGILSAKLFTMMVIMALVTTFMTGPMLNLIAKYRRTVPLHSS
ncbi:MAG: sodium/hydrogen exchanger [Halothiobacillaceae bacterium]|nr:MAG: sodium/hydrogen exchanger [Halothiobacillaceae bacterium]